LKRIKNGLKRQRNSKKLEGGKRSRRLKRKKKRRDWKERGDEQKVYRLTKVRKRAIV